MSAPLHERIRADFEKHILAGDLAPGDRLPTEQDLMRHYGCARMTVSRALSALAAAGLIDRRKRAGTFVARPRVHSMVLDVPDLAAQIRARGETYAFRLLRARARPPHAGQAHERWVAGAGPLLALDGLHLADDVPIAIEHRLIGLAAVPAARDTDFAAVSPGSWLLQHVPWTEAETRISALGCPPVDAHPLGIDAGAPCLCIERRTWRGGDPVTHVRQLFLAHAYDLVARFGPAATQAAAARDVDACEACA